MTYVAPTHPSWPDLTAQIDDHFGVLRIKMGDLRSIEGAQRINENLNQRVSDRLRDMGVGHLPAELPSRADQPIVLYRRGTNAAETIRAIAEGLDGSNSEAVTFSLRNLNTPSPEDRNLVPAEQIQNHVKQAVDALTALLGDPDIGVEVPPPPLRFRRRR